MRAAHKAKQQSATAAAGNFHTRTAVPDQPAGEAQKDYKTHEKHNAGSGTHNSSLQRKTAVV
jgi:hypothetical protein